MSVTQYTIPCGYKIPRLKDYVYFVDKLTAKVINIDNGTATATINNPSPYPMSPNRLKGFNINLSETESLDERYRFTKQLTISIHGYLTNSQFLMDNDYFLVVEDYDGNYYLVNVDFPSKMTYTYNLSEGQNQTDFTFTSNSNFPLLKLNWEIAKWTDCETYICNGVQSLKMLEKDYTTIDIDGAVINLFDGNEFKDVDFLKGSLSLQESYDGDVTVTTITYNIPLSNTQSSWHYNLLEFTQNLYAAHITPKNTGSGIFCGYQHGLQPSYELVGSTGGGEATMIKITLTEASSWGIFEFDSWSYNRDSSKKWVGIDSEVKCTSLGVGINTLMEEFDSNGTPTGRYKCLEGYESEYTNYNIVGTYTEDEVESFRTSVCTRFRSRAGESTGLYTCVDGDKYELLVSTISYDGGKTWMVDEGTYELGEMVESGSSWCETEPAYKWRLTNKYQCGAYQTRWVVVSGGFVCSGNTKMTLEKRQFSVDEGATWNDTSPLETRAALPVIEYYSNDCEYTPDAKPDFLESFTDYKIFYYNVVPGYWGEVSFDYAPCDGNIVLTENDLNINCCMGSATTLCIGDCVEVIDGHLLYNDKDVGTIYFGKNLKYIGPYSFVGVSTASISIPASVVEIGDHAFYSAESIKFKSGNPPILVGTPFSTTATLYVPSAAIENYRNGDGWSSYINQITPY